MSITSVVNDTVTSVSILNAQKPLPPTITNYSVGGLDDTALDPAGGQTVQINGTGFLAGVTITFDGSAVSVVTYVNPNQLTFTSPAKSAGTYTIYVINPDGGTAIYIPGIIYSVLPTWTTGAGTLGSYYETQSISNTVVASGDAPITYSLYSGSLPTGSTLAANGVITGTAPVDSSSTTYSFTIEAIDAQLQGSTRSFSLTINTDVVTWVSPANATTYTSAVDSAIANVTLNATDAAGYGIVYTANSLPTGLSLSGNTISGTPTVIADSSTLLTATANTTSRTATRTINWSITVANDPYFEYNTLLIPGASTTFVDDASTNNFAVSIFGDTKPNNSNPYTPGYYSNFFQAGAGYTSGNGLSVAANSAFAFGTGDFTVEFWTRPPAFGSGSSTAPTMVAVHNGATDSGWQLYWNDGYIGIRTYYSNVVYWNADMTPYLNQWSHIAYVRYNGTQKIYINGQEKCSTASVWNWTDNTVGIGYKEQYYTGNISNLRMIKGTALYTSNFTPPTGPLTAVSGTSLLTCQSNRFIDNSTNNFAITLVNSPTISSAQPFTTNSSYSTYGSGYFDGTGDYLTVPNNTSLGMGSGNFTVEFWVYQTSLVSYRQILDVVDGNSVGRLILWVDSAGTLYNLGQNGNARNTTAAGAITINTWIHVALVRSSGTTKFYINGTQSGSNYTDSTNYTCTTGSVYIGINSDGGTYPYQGYLTDFRMVKGTAVYTTTFTPPSAPLTAISGTSLLTLQNNQSVNNSTFLDNSSGNLPVTYVGLATQGTFSPYGGNWSNYFDGSGDYLSVASNAVFGFGTGDFTIEFWAYSTSSARQDWIDISDGSNRILFYYTGSAVTFYGNGSAVITGSAITLNTWVHYALSKSSGSTKLFVNGTQAGSTYATSQNYGSAASVSIGKDMFGSTYITGYMSNIRMVKGTAVYTSNFTPPTTPLTPITNTSLLTGQSPRFIDNSINNFTITNNGNTSVQRFSPFNPSSVTPTSYSGYFDGTSDTLTLTGAAGPEGTQDFTFEVWWNISNMGGSYPRLFETTTSNGFQIYLSSGTLGVAQNGGSILVSYNISSLTNQWLHVCVTRSGANMRLFINGVLRSYTASGGVSFASSTSWGIYTEGGGPIGYASNLRIVRGSVVADYVTSSTTTGTTIFTPPTSPLTAIANTSLLTLQSPTFIDNSTNNFPMATTGNTTPSIQNPFGYSSLPTQGYTPSTIGGSNYSNNTGTIYSNIASPISGTTMDWTMEAWVYFNSLGSTSWIFGLGNNTGGNTPYVEMRTIDTTAVRFAEATTVTTAWAIQVSYTFTAGQWYHFAGTRSGNTIRLFINGIQIGSTTYSSAIQSGMKPFTQGLLFSSGGARSDGVNGYVSDTRMIASTPLYTSNFVPPIQPLQAIKNTSWLINGTSAGIYDVAMMNDMQTINGTSLNTALTKFGGSSMYFDGSDDHIQASNTQPLSTGNFTIEFWIYPLDTASRYIFSFGEGWSPADGVSMIQYGGNYAITCGSYGTANAGQAVEINGWHHIAIVRNGTAVNFYYDGVSKASGTDSTNLTASKLDIGYAFTGGSWGTFYGYMDDWRVTKGYARYTSNFTPPTTPFLTY